ncbi:MAG TPA: type I-C CRISPR-associated protein Cas8c/Csd1 [Gemmataceae bacterium]|nr:type I-C CRISPR-associated protein Cas8c/Csd1 [Gemmataceae bacterium]
MLLQRLRDHAASLDLAPAMYLRTPIRWLLDLNSAGELLGQLIRTEGSGGRNDRGKEFLAPHRERTVAVMPKLLADNAEYVLGIARDPAKQERVDRCHRAFVALVRDCAEQTKHPAVRAVAFFYDGYRRGSIRLPEDFKPDQLMTFRVEGVLPIELEEVRRYWAEATGGRPEDTSDAAGISECLVCGERRRVLANIPFKIKRIPNGQTSGMALVSTNARAFESYALGAMSCAPVCAGCGEHFSKAANALLEGERTHLSVGNLAYIFWARESTWSPASILANPEPEEVRTLLAASFGGDRAALRIEDGSFGEEFYATAFSASGARVVVRDWLETTVPRAKVNLARYFRLQQLVGEWGEVDAGFLPLQGYWTGEPKPHWRDGLAESVAPPRQGRRDVNKLPPGIPQALLRVALHDGQLPESLLFQAVQRNRAEQGVTRPRAALIKMVLLSHSVFPEDAMAELQPNNTDAAYLCGRLLAVLEALQRVAIPGTKATITDRYFGTASSAPASVFGRLLRGAQAHLAKLRKDAGGAYRAYQEKLEEIQKGLRCFPPLLRLQDQGKFCLGYYHQRAADRAAARAAREAREQSQTTNA